jgi:hypothetical protein
MLGARLKRGTGGDCRKVGVTSRPTSIGRRNMMGLLPNKIRRLRQLEYERSRRGRDEELQNNANGPYWKGSYSLAMKGLWPHQSSIAKGIILYRFVDLSKAPSAIAADGPWWFEFEHYQRIRHFSLQHKYPLGYCARMFAAVLYEWSDVNAVVRAEVTAGTLLVWKGKGKQVSASGKDPRDVSTSHGLVTGTRASTPKMTPMQGPLEVLQLYIPGLGAPHRKFGTLMKLLGSEQIPTS